MKKIIISMIILIMIVFLVACNNQKSVSKEEVKTNDNMLTAEEAKNIAIKHANLNSKDIDIVKEEHNIEDGIEKYDIEFYYKDKYYDYEINAYTGDILEIDNDIEDYTIIDPLQKENNRKLTLEQAKDIALKNENLTIEKVKFIKEEYKVENEVEKYDIEFYYNNTEYDYEIDVNNGKILKSEKNGK